MIAAVAEMLKFNKSIEELILNKASINKEGIAAIRFVIDFTLCT
jgi:hypothetical protein